MSDNYNYSVGCAVIRGDEGTHQVLYQISTIKNVKEKTIRFSFKEDQEK